MERGRFEPATSGSAFKCSNHPKIIDNTTVFVTQELKLSLKGRVGKISEPSKCVCGFLYVYTCK